jgi:hypothetical protein
MATKTNTISMLHMTNDMTAGMEATKAETIAFRGLILGCNFAMKRNDRRERNPLTISALGSPSTNPDTKYARDMQNTHDCNFCMRPNDSVKTSKLTLKN